MKKSTAIDFLKDVFIAAGAEIVIIVAKYVYTLVKKQPFVMPTLPVFLFWFFVILAIVYILEFARLKSIAWIEKTIDEKIKAIRIDEKIDSVVNATDSIIKDVQQTTDATIITLEKDTDAKIITLEKDTDAKILASEKVTDARILNLESRLEAKITEVAKVANEKIAAMYKQ